MRTREFQISVLVSIPPGTRKDPENIAEGLEKAVAYAVQNWYEDEGEPRKDATQCPSVTMEELDP